MTFDINEKFAELIFNWSQEEDEGSSAKELGKSLLILIIDMELTNSGISNADENVRKQIQKELAAKNKVAPRIGGDQTVAQEAIHKLLIEDFEGGVDLLINNIQERKIHIKEYISEASRKKAQKSRPDALNDLLMIMLKENPKITESEVIEKLENKYDDNIYIEDEDLGITVETDDGKKRTVKQVKITGLKNRLSRLRIKMIAN
jgi:hypothetical protein